MFHNGSIKKKVLKYGTPKPRFYGLRFYGVELQQACRLGIRFNGWAYGSGNSYCHRDPSGGKGEGGRGTILPALIRSLLWACRPPTPPPPTPLRVPMILSYRRSDHHATGTATILACGNHSSNFSHGIGNTVNQCHNSPAWPLAIQCLTIDFIVILVISRPFLAASSSSSSPSPLKSSAHYSRQHQHYGHHLHLAS